MAFVSGPRQAGKTTMAKQLLKQRGAGHYYNWDELKFRRIWTKDPSQIIPISNSSSSVKPLIILDEIHKAKLWKRSLKGIYDTHEIPFDILVTGSARLNVYRKGSDSLMGRYYHFRLHPFSLSEMSRNNQWIPEENLLTAILTRTKPATTQSREYLHQLYEFGPFPEPLFAGSKRILNLWQKNRVEKIIREDLRDLSRLPELSQIEMLAALLPERTAQPFSTRSLSEDLEVSYTTIRRWMNYLKELYYCFELKPYSKSLPRSIKKEGKLYLWDWSEIENEGARFENLISGHLLKYCHYLSDAGYGAFELYYLKNKDKKEIDFLIVKDKKPWLPIEAKLNHDAPSENWGTFAAYLACPYSIQVTKKSGIFKLIQKNAVQVLLISADEFLNYLI
ncbi:MAG: ATP-binding protein [Proteobacteria bacterium]|nr:ATP-binding protein [Pseudomonadota bacterium]